MLYLIDGYNLLYQSGILHGRVGPAGLQKARLALLGRLRAGLGNEATQVTVVFDAANAPPGAVEIQDYHGIRVRFAIQHQQADDLIEQLIRQDSAPRQLTVVSDDHRVQKAGQRRRCQVLSCASFLDLLERQRKPAKPRPADASAKPDGSSGAETQHWLREFADLENDPDFKEVFNPFDFEEDKKPDK
jgi:predicted RNA-binding protein with PIN domain